MVQRFEYLRETTHYNEPQEMLDKKQDEGWELVAVTQNDQFYTLFFKRPVTPTE